MWARSRGTSESNHRRQWNSPLSQPSSRTSAETDRERGRKKKECILCFVRVFWIIIAIVFLFCIFFHVHFVLSKKYTKCIPSATRIKVKLRTDTHTECAPSAQATNHRFWKIDCARARAHHSSSGLILRSPKVLCIAPSQFTHVWRRFPSNDSSILFLS